MAFGNFKSLQAVALADLPNLFAAWNYVFAQARDQALAPAA